MTFYDPIERLDEVDRNEWAVRQHLYAERLLARLPDDAERRRRIARELSEMQPRSPWCCRRGCDRPGSRTVRITGDVFCAEHDPLRLCEERDGPWKCSVGFAGHGWAHRLMTLEGEA